MACVILFSRRHDCNLLHPMTSGNENTERGWLRGMEDVIIASEWYDVRESKRMMHEAL